MKKKYFAFFLVVFLISAVSARISISQPSEIYSLGDTIYTTITLNPSVVEGNFEVRVVCGEDSKTFYMVSPAESVFTAGQETKINHKIILEKQYIGNLSGDCNILASLGNILASSDRFKISSDISLKASLDKEFYDPGESVVLDLEAIKANGQKLNGFVRSEGIFSFEKAISDGKIREVFSTAKNLEAGEYELNLFVYEKGKNEEIINYKNSSVVFSVNQIPYSVPITLSSLEINPGEEFEFQVELFDQSGRPMSGLINVDFVSPKREIISKTVEAGGRVVIGLDSNASFGNWVLSSSFGKIKEERDIYVRKVPKIEFDFLGNSSVLVIRNVGNDIYVGQVIVEIGNESLNYSLIPGLGPGEESKFTLSAPSGEYNVRISAGEDSIERTLLLTGRVIDISEYGRFLVISQYPFVWSIIATLVILLAIVAFFRYNKKTFKLKERFGSFKMKREVTQKPAEQSVSSGKGNAEASLVIKGTREPSTVVSITLRNELKPFMKENLNKLLEELNKHNAAIEFKEREVLVIFSPRKTKTFKNEYNAIKMSFELVKALEEMNRKFREKINFGVGIHSGDLVSSLEGNNLRYTSVDNTIVLSRRISEVSSQEVMVSERVKNKLLREVRTEKVEKNGNTYYKVVRLSEREDNQARLQDLLKRTHLKDQ